MAPEWLQPIFVAIFQKKRKTRVFPYITLVCELFSTTLFIFFTTATWKVGGGTYGNIEASVPKIVYQYEVGSSASSTRVNKKIGLMYVGDYGFAASQEVWTTKLISYDSNTSNNWLFLGSIEWTISRNSDLTRDVFRVTGTGTVNANFVTYSLGVFPSFNLESSVKYVSGSGSMSDPVRIN